MKRFQFALNTVLDFKQQTLDALLGEHAEALRRVREKERAIEEMRLCYAAHDRAFREKKESGIEVREARLYESGLRALEGEIAAESEKLLRLQAAEEEKRREVVEARKETSSLEKLRERQLDSYQKELQKDEEQRIEEFVSLKRMMSGRA